ncbi:MAG: indole-3-glycerol phosphate synthase TrpC [Akkermansia sp.]
MDYLAEILKHKQIALKKILPLEGKLRAAAILRNEYAGFRSCLDVGENRLSVVPELARSTYPFNQNEEDYNPSRLGERMIQGGAQALSIITEPHFYKGSFADLTQLSKSSQVPVLSRDYWTHPAEVCQAIIGGADAINLIVAAIPQNQLSPLYAMATGLGLDVMIEVHSLAETEIALDLDADFICINHCDPHTLKMDMNLTDQLIDEIPADVTVLSTGGIDTPEVAQRMLEAGAHGVILGHHLMQAHLPQEIIAEILQLRYGERE